MNIIDKLTNELLEKDLVISIENDKYYITNGVKQLSYTIREIELNLVSYGYRGFVNRVKKTLNSMSRC